MPAESKLGKYLLKRNAPKKVVEAVNAPPYAAKRVKIMNSGDW